MDEKTRLIVLQILTTLTSITSSQIHFPQENNPIPQSSASSFAYVPESESLLTDLTTIDTGRPSASASRNYDQIARGITKLTLDINRIIPSLYPDIAHEDHVVLGPVTITGALALVLSASVGQTFNEIANFLGLRNSQNDFGKMQEQLGQFYSNLEMNSGLEMGQLINFATGIFVQKEYQLRPAFEQVANVIYKSKVTNVDFQRSPRVAQKIINDFVSERTHNKIPSLLADPPPTNTRSIIASVFYFKAAWEFPFYDGHTKLRPFYINGRKSPSDRMVEMMSNGGEFPYYKDNGLGVQILGFPYRGRRTTMYVILPNDSNREKLKRLENSLTPDDIQRLVSSTKYTETVILFPKMTLETTVDLSTVLQSLGVTSLFNPYEANLALLSSGLRQRFNSDDRQQFNSGNGQQFNSAGSGQQFNSAGNGQQFNSGNRQQFNSEDGQQFNFADAQQFNSGDRQQFNSGNRQQFNGDSEQFNSGDAPFVSPPISTPSSAFQPPPYPQNKNEDEDRLIFTRFGNQNNNCDQVYDYVTNTSMCRQTQQPQQQNQQRQQSQQQRQRGGKARPRVVPLSTRAAGSFPSMDLLESLRYQTDLQNPGLYADQVIHKVYIDITESGTEAASATGVSLNRSGGRVTFRVDMPFIFFIYHEDTKGIMFWGSVKSPSPSVLTRQGS